MQKFKNPDNDSRGVWTSGDLTSKTKAAGHSYALSSGNKLAKAAAKFVTGKGNGEGGVGEIIQEYLTKTV